MNKEIILEEAALKVAKQSQIPPKIYNLPVSEGREVLEKIQDGPVYKYPVLINKIRIKIANQIVNLYLVKKRDIKKYKHVIFYVHGAGFVFGSFHTHEKLIRELAFQTDSILVFPEYTRSPEAKFPTALNECFDILKQLPKILKIFNIDYENDLVLAGDSVGGNLAIALTFLAKENGPKINKLVLFYPVTDDNFNTESYIKFANNYYLDREGMIWFFDNYLKDKIPEDENLSNILVKMEKLMFYEMKAKHLLEN